MPRSNKKLSLSMKRFCQGIRNVVTVAVQYFEQYSGFILQSVGISCLGEWED